MEKSGCGLAVGGALAVVMAMGIFNASQCNRGGKNPDAVDTVVATVGEVSIDARQVAELVENQQRQFGASMELPPFLEVSLLGGALQQLIDGGLQVELAKQKGIALTDDAIVAFYNGQIDDLVKSERERLVKAGKIKADATDAQYTEALKKDQPGFTSFEDLRKRNEDLIRQTLADPTKRTSAVLQTAQAMIAAAETKRLNLTEEEVLKDYDEFTLKRVYLSEASNKGKDLKAEAEKILAEIKGGTTFEQAMDKYSNDAPTTPKERVSKNELKYGTAMLLGDPRLVPLAALKKGDVSGVLDEFGGVAIYKVVDVKRQLPKDWDKNKTQLIQQAKQSRVIREVQKAIEEMRKQDRVVWKSAGYKVVFDFQRLSSDPSVAGDAAKLKERQKELLADAETAIEKDPVGSNAAKLVRFVMFESEYAQATAEEKKALSAKRIEYAKAIPQYDDKPGLQLQVVDMYVDAGDKENAGQTLLEAARANMDTSDLGKSNHGAMLTKLAQLREKKQIDEETAKLVDEQLERWVTDKAAAEKESAELRKMEEQAQKERDAAKKADEAEQQKLLDEAKKSSGTKAPPTDKDKAPAKSPG
ncbi:MAG: SurA N-terminal domain-containing protein [Fimbriimonadaceae bacterium]|nr:SurA N-terminal domain-containing protein [Fimbriimonadaceae bacterium]